MEYNRRLDECVLGVGYEGVKNKKAHCLLQVSPLVLSQTKVNGREELASPPQREAQTSGSDSTSRTGTRNENRDSIQSNSSDTDNQPQRDSPLIQYTSPSIHTVKVFTSSEHSIQPSDKESSEEPIPSFSLSRRSTSKSMNSDVEVHIGSSPNSPGYEGTDL